jgi:hypothetical protein
MLGRRASRFSINPVIPEDILLVMIALIFHQNHFNPILGWIN